MTTGSMFSRSVLCRIGFVRSTLLSPERWISFGLALATICLIMPLPAVAQGAKPTEYQVKAAYLSNLGRFVESWGPHSRPSADEPFAICVLGQDPFGPSLDAAIRDENIEGAPLVAKRITNTQDAQGCRVLFISSSEENRLSAVLAALGDSPVLTVADLPDFSRRGGMIQFVLDGNRVRFDISVSVATKSGLTLSSELLKVARVVRRGP